MMQSTNGSLSDQIHQGLRDAQRKNYRDEIKLKLSADGLVKLKHEMETVSPWSRERVMRPSFFGFTYEVVEMEPLWKVEIEKRENG